MIACQCSNFDCLANGCRLARQSPSLHQQYFPPMPPQPRGCICPPTSEETCKARFCGRRDNLATGAST